MGTWSPGEPRSQSMMTALCERMRPQSSHQSREHLVGFAAHVFVFTHLRKSELAIRASMELTGMLLAQVLHLFIDIWVPYFALRKCAARKASLG